MQRFGNSFDHNLHALRIVESFEQRYARFPGLNLTFEVREGMVKHSHDFGPGQSPELDAFLPGLRPLLEAQLIDLADEIAYNAADLDDAFSAGMFTAAEIAACVPQYGPVLGAVETQFPGASAREQFHEALRQVIDALVSGLVEGTVAAAERSGASDAESVRHVPYRLAAFSPETGDTSRSLKRFLHARVYATPELAEDRRRSVAMIGELFTFFTEDPRRLPAPYARQAESIPRHRVICDYIAGMTDAFCRRTYEQAIGPAAPAR